MNKLRNLIIKLTIGLIVYLTLKIGFTKKEKPTKKTRNKLLYLIMSSHGKIILKEKKTTEKIMNRLRFLIVSGWLRYEKKREKKKHRKNNE